VLCQGLGRRNHNSSTAAAAAAAAAEPAAAPFAAEAAAAAAAAEPAAAPFAAEAAEPAAGGVAVEASGCHSGGEARHYFVQQKGAGHRHARAAAGAARGRAEEVGEGSEQRQLEVRQRRVRREQRQQAAHQLQRHPGFRNGPVGIATVGIATVGMEPVGMEPGGALAKRSGVVGLGRMVGPRGRWSIVAAHGAWHGKVGLRRAKVGNRKAPPCAIGLLAPVADSSSCCQCTTCKQIAGGVRSGNWKKVVWQRWLFKTP
jgi:hypothetical protein